MTGGAESGIGRRRASAKSGSAPDYAAKRSELIRVAAEVFRDKGYAAATLNDVAAAFGTDRASLYYYVGSKEELFRECVTTTFSESLASAREIAASPRSPREKLEALIGMLIRGQVDHYPYAYLYIQEDMARVASDDSDWAQGMVAATREIERAFLDAIKEGIADGSIRPDVPAVLIANSIFGMTQWTHRWYVPTSSPYSADDLVRAFTEILFGGVAR